MILTVSKATESPQKDLSINTSHVERGKREVYYDKQVGKAVMSALKGGKRDVDCDKQIEKAVTAPNCMLKGSWGEGGSRGIRKKLKSEYAAYLESKYRRNDGSSI